MTPKAEIILEGTYLYYTGEVNYSQEEFKLVHFKNEEVFHFYAEIVSRLENGEFLKILVRYEMNSQFIPTFVRIEKSLGNKYALETFKIDISTFELKYAFQTNQKVQKKCYIKTLPNFSGRMHFRYIYTLKKNGCQR